MQLSDFDYNLPEELIAQRPSEPRNMSRLFILHKNHGNFEHRQFNDLIDYLHPGDVLVLNNSKVFPARLLGTKETGGKVEIFLTKEMTDGVFEAIGKNLKEKSQVRFAGSSLRALVLSREGEMATVKFNLSGEEFYQELEKIGKIPLPPYIKRENQEADKDNYQTVYAKERGSVAAPTAGLHFTPEVLQKIRAKGIEIQELTLHVGLGTFLPVKTEKITEHKMHSEHFVVKKEVISRICEAKSTGKKIIAVGTTTTRVLEYIFKEGMPAIKDFSGSTSIFIFPGFQFNCIDGLVTNFHLPKSTLLLLISAFAGKDKVFKAYNEAIKQNYRFFSYGDAMLIVN